jgi:hypothetical protein
MEKVKPERPIRFFCTECGKEMWSMVNFERIKDETIEEILYTLNCSDCMLEEIHKTK